MREGGGGRHARGLPLLLRACTALDGSGVMGRRDTPLSPIKIMS